MADKKNGQEGWETIRQAALAAGVSRQAVARWVEAGLLRSKAGAVGHLAATFVRVADVRELAETHKPGRPPKGGAAAKRARKGA
jgi:hypothetical protein